MLNCGESAAWRFVAVDPDIAHVADVEDPNAVAHSFVLGHQATARRILDGHIPTAEIDHFRAQFAVKRVQRRSTEFGFGSRVYGVHPTRSGRKRWEHARKSGSKNPRSEPICAKLPP